MKIRLKFEKKGYMIYISHLDLMRLFHRVFRRAGVSLKHSEGFNPQPKMAFATALSLGTVSYGEYLDAEIEESVEIEGLLDRINDKLPEGLLIVKGEEKKDDTSIMSLIRWSDYKVRFKTEFLLGRELLEEKLNSFLKLEEIIERKEKKKNKKITVVEKDIRNFIKKIDIHSMEDEKIELYMFLRTGSDGNLNPGNLVKIMDQTCQIGAYEDSIKIERIDLYIEKEDRIVTPV